LQGTYFCKQNKQTNKKNKKQNSKSFMRSDVVLAAHSQAQNSQSTTVLLPKFKKLKNSTREAYKTTNNIFHKPT